MTLEIGLSLLSILMILVASLAAVYVQRNLNLKDEAHQKWQTDMETRMSKAQDGLQAQAISMKDFISRTEMNAQFDKVYASIAKLDEGMANNFKEFQRAVISAIGH